MKKVTVCIGSSCHLKGSRQIIETLKELIDSHGLKNEVELAGTFCMGNCKNEGVSVSVNDVVFSLTPEDTKEFFNNYILNN